MMIIIAIKLLEATIGKDFVLLKVLHCIVRRRLEHLPSVPSVVGGDYCAQIVAPLHAFIFSAKESYRSPAVSIRMGTDVLQFATTARGKHLAKFCRWCSIADDAHLLNRFMAEAYREGIDFEYDKAIIKRVYALEIST